MNLFRSEEHARNWAQFDPAMEEEYLKPLSYWVERFSGEGMRMRLREDFVSWRLAQRRER